jgi:hypothetical protein
MVMLGGLLAIPAVALFGTGLSETVKQLVQRQLGINTVSSAASFSEAPLFVPGSHPEVSPPLAPPVVTLPMAAQPTLAPAMASPAADQSSPSAPLADPFQSGTVKVSAEAGTASAVSYQTPQPTGSETFSGPQPIPSGGVPVTRSIYETPVNLVPVSRRSPGGELTPGDVRPLLALQETGGTQRASRAGADRFSACQARLRELGSTYCLLETWGSGAELYRFYCKVGIRGSTNFTRSFEATDPDPVGALSKVVQQVEEWCQVAAGNR